MPLQSGNEFNLNLLENGIDFIRSGIEDYFLNDDRTPRDHKYAVLHVFSGALLLLKERLQRAHPSLIFSKVERMNDPGARTVDFDEVINRLRNCANVNIDDEHMATLRDAQNIRNQLEHHKVSLDLIQTQSILGRLCQFVYVFMRDELNTDLMDHLTGDVSLRIISLQTIAEAMEKKRRADWKVAAQKYSRLSPDALLKLHDEHLGPEGLGADGRMCPECHELSMVITKLVDDSVDEDTAICTNTRCAVVRPLQRCRMCNGIVFTEAGWVICDTCLDKYAFNAEQP